MTNSNLSTILLKLFVQCVIIVTQLVVRRESYEKIFINILVLTILITCVACGKTDSANTDSTTNAESTTENKTESTTNHTTDGETTTESTTDENTTETENENTTKLQKEENTKEH